MSATRVYILAKELKVKSSAIVSKCQDEGLDVKNHMSTISAGLAATIHEWFSEGENITTIETSKKVDLKKARVKKSPVRKPSLRKRKTASVKKEQKQDKSSIEVGTIAQPVEAADERGEATEAPEQIEVKKKKPKRKTRQPEKIIPAGPMMEKPAPASVSGPKVIRVEKPDVKRPPRPKRQIKPKYKTSVTEPLISEDVIQKQVDLKKTDKKPFSKRDKDRTHGRRREDYDTEAPGGPKFSRHRQRDIEERKARLTAAGGGGLRARPARKVISKSSTGKAGLVERPTKATVTEPVTVKDLSAALAVKTSEIIYKLMQQNIMATVNQLISSDVAELVALEFGTELTIERKKRIEEQIQHEFENRTRNNLKKRPVMATMLGHVDHGKTSLLDKIRSTHVTDGEAGGITQHVGTYQVTRGEHKVTFVDTPGHAAFTAMRARGANMTDVVVLVVALDDGVMPQTIEVIDHAKAANVPIIVALNKSDLPGCDVNRVYSQLAEHDLAPVEWGGSTDIVKTSAVTGEGIDDLLEHLDYMAELLELKADDTIPATGWLVEAEMSSKRGVVATLLIKEGRLNLGDVILAGNSYGRVKTLIDTQGGTIQDAVSSMPVEVTGLNDVPQAGDRFYCLDDINMAKDAAEENQVLSRESTLARRTQVTLDNLFSQIEAGNVKDLNLIIRADVQGSVDVLTDYLSELSTEEVKIKILHASPGGVTEGDVVLAEASNAIVIGFNVVPEEHVAKIAELKGVDVKLYSVIYRITEDLRKSMEGLLEPDEKEESVGKAIVRTLFKVSRIGTIAGCYVTEGTVKNKVKIRLIRDNVVVRDALNIESLKHFKDDVREVRAGLECGIKIVGFDDIKVDDVLDFYEVVKVARTLD